MEFGGLWVEWSFGELIGRFRKTSEWCDPGFGSSRYVFWAIAVENEEEEDGRVEGPDPSRDFWPNPLTARLI